MENKKIIIILIAIIVVLASILGVLYTQSINAKEPTEIKITSDKTQNEGGKLSIQLTDLNKTAISKETVNITITNSKGKVVVNETVKTNSKGKANLDLDLKKGKYSVNVTFNGNENYTGNSTTQKLTIKEEEVVQAEVTSSSSSDQSYSEPSDWTDSEGVHHFYENGQEYVGDPNAQHLTIEQHNYVKEHGMR